MSKRKQTEHEVASQGPDVHGEPRIVCTCGAQFRPGVDRTPAEIFAMHQTSNEGAS